jgi:hypothetical protein
MGFVAQPPDIVDGIGGSGPRAKGRTTDIDGVGTMADGLYAAVGIPRGR